MKYTIECQSCASVYTGDKIDNCKHCGSPVRREDVTPAPRNTVYTQEVPVYGGNTSPMTISRLDDPMTCSVRYHAEQMINGKQYACGMQISEYMIMDSGFNLREYVERYFRKTFADLVANQTEIVYRSDLTGCGGDQGWKMPNITG